MLIGAAGSELDRICGVSVTKVRSRKAVVVQIREVGCPEKHKGWRVKFAMVAR
jgi:hypothetical protein